MATSARAVPISGKPTPATNMIDGNATPSSVDATPPPTLSHTYQRSTLLSLATPPKSIHSQDPTAPLPRRLSSFAPILRCSVALSESEWGVSEDNSSLLDGQPVSKDLPIPSQGMKHPADRSTVARSDSGSDGELLFHYSSFTESVGRPAPAPLPVLVDFNNPFGNAALANINIDNDHSGNDNNNDNGNTNPGSFTESPMPVDSAVHGGNKGVDDPHAGGEADVRSLPIPSRAQTMGADIQTQAQPDLLQPQPKSHLEAAAAGLPIRLGVGPLSRKSSLSNPNPSHPSTTTGGSAPPAFGGQVQTQGHAFPSSVNSSTTSLASMRMGPRESIADIRANLLSSLGAATGAGGAALSRSNSNSSLNSERSSFSLPGPAIEGGKLNPFAPPFPLPNATPSDTKQNNDGAAASPEIQASLPLPKPTSLGLAPAAAAAAAATAVSASGTSTPGGTPIPLPSSLPARPGPLPPVFVKRESAALPQPMALRDVAPLGKDWEGEHTISGNERRRRASHVSINSTSGLGHQSLGLPAGFGSSLGTGSLSRRGSFVSDSGLILGGTGGGGGGAGSGRNSPALSRAGSASGTRPERLVKLGQGLRSHSPQPQSRRGSTSLKP